MKRWQALIAALGVLLLFWQPAWAQDHQGDTIRVELVELEVLDEAADAPEEPSCELPTWWWIQFNERGNYTTAPPPSGSTTKVKVTTPLRPSKEAVAQGGEVLFEVQVECVTEGVDQTSEVHHVTWQYVARPLWQTERSKRSIYDRHINADEISKTWSWW
jgi:hypothetical protein